MKASLGKQKKILIDICHIPQFNLFKEFIIKNYKKWNIEVILLDRGKLVPIAEKELPSDVSITLLGDYQKNTNNFSLIFFVIIPRIFQLFKLISNKRYSMVLSSAWYAIFVAKFYSIPSVILTDDIRPIIKYIWKFSAKEIYLPFFHKTKGKIKTFNCLKEWAYLNTSTFTPDSKALESHSANENEYIFMREVSVKSANYSGQTSNSILSVANQISDEVNVILSLEDKKLKDKYPSHWTILEEPVFDIHSLMYYSLAVVSSGDSVAREGAILGVPSIYVGQREMPANNVMVELGKLSKIDVNQLPDIVNSKMGQNKNKNDQEAFRNTLNEKWERIEDVLNRIVNKYT